MRVLTVCICLCLCLAGADLTAQSLSLESVDNLYSTDTLPVNQQATFNIRMSNPTATQYGGIANGFRVYSPDGAEWTQTVPDTFSWGWPDMFPLIFAVLAFSNDGVGSDTVAFGGARLASGGLTPGFDEVAYKITIGPIDPSYHRNTICLDSSFYPTSGVWKWASPDEFPAWDGPHCFKVFDPNAPTESNIVLSNDMLNFSVVEDDPPPAVQTFDVTSDNAPLSVDVTETSSWIIASPIIGTTPFTVNVQINNTGLGVGTYLDSIEISSDNGLNSPLWVYVNLEVLPKPAEIGYTPDAFFFNAIASGSNPADKYLTITNLGGVPLDWTVSNSTSWLSLAPTTGTDSGDVTLSVDITGLAFGEYDDTIEISDPNAVNSPQEVPVHLSVSSDLPLIELDSSLYHVISTPNNASPDPKQVGVLNGGAGLMTYDIVGTSPRIDSIVPTSGTAPENVMIYFDLTGTLNGQTIYDTLQVTSNEAVNSPQDLVIEYHIVSLPAEIDLNKDTAHLVMYECGFGIGIKPSDIFTISNTPSPDPLDYVLTYDTDFFTVSITEGDDWDVVTLTAQDASLPLGFYYDTIMISSEYAINSPQYIYVEYQVREGTMTPEVFVSENLITIPTQENEGPLNPYTLLVLNRHPGCMEWYVDEDITWMTPTPDTGDVPSTISLHVDGTGVPFGDHLDTMYVTAMSASNSPYPTRLRLRVWRFHGDYDYNGVLNITDILLMVEQFFNFGPGPIPEERVGDLNCDQEVDIEDLLYFVEYAFNNGPIPCGNPY